MTYFGAPGLPRASPAASGLACIRHERRVGSFDLIESDVLTCSMSDSRRAGQLLQQILWANVWFIKRTPSKPSLFDVGGRLVKKRTTSSLEKLIPRLAKGCDPITVMVEPKTTDAADPSYESYAEVTRCGPGSWIFELRASYELRQKTV